MSASGKHFFGEGLLKVFPTPEFLTMPATGIDITDNTARFLSFKETNEGKRIAAHGSYPIPSGVIRDGKITDKGKLIEVLAQMQRENGIQFINASLPEQQAYLFQTTIPNESVDKTQLRTILEFKLEENVPISSRELVFDYEVVEETKQEIILNIIAYPQAPLADYIEVFDAAGFTILSFEIEAQSLARAVIPRHHSGTYMIVDFGKMRTGIGIVEGEVLRFTSTISVGGAMLSRAIEKHFGISKEEADIVKNEKGFAVYKKNTEVLETLIATVSILRDEVRRHYNYWNESGNQKIKRKVDKIVLCGGSANLAGLAEYLSTDINVVVDVADVWANAFSLNDVIPDIAYRHSLSYATSIGLALKGMR